MILVLVTLGSRGDVAPFVALGQALVEAGHEVRLVTQSEFGSLGRNTGVGLRLIDMDDSRELLGLPAARAALRRNYDPLAIARLMSALAPQFERVYRVTLAAARDADAVLCHPMTFPALDVADRLRLPVIQVHHVPAVPTRAFPCALGHRIGHTLGPVANRLSYSADGWLAWGLTGRIMNRLGGDILNRPPISTRQALTLRRRRAGVVVGVSPQVLPRPADWPADVVTTGYLRTAAREGVPLDSATRRFLADGAPPVLVTLGSTPVPNPERTSRIMVSAARAAGLRIILQRGVAGLDHTDDPHSLHVVDQLDYDQILRQVAAVVHHGGAGTLAQVLTHGKPSLVLPSFADQFFWAHRVPAIGAGPRPLPLKSLTEVTLTRRLRELADDPRYASRAQAIGARISEEDGPRNATTAINGFLA
ncbi:glycosyltransferase [Micromonospora sp. NPDC049900]|uniref:glycosyltransferase n=1 Tax=unclassified Micromonospora TaxID=2617518 RepID=UPI0037AC85CB